MGARGSKSSRQQQRQKEKPIQLRCNNCNALLQLPHWAPQAKCPRCESLIQVPSPQPQAQPPAYNDAVKPQQQQPNGHKLNGEEVYTSPPSQQATPQQGTVNAANSRGYADVQRPPRQRQVVTNPGYVNSYGYPTGYYPGAYPYNNSYNKGPGVGTVTAIAVGEGLLWGLLLGAICS